jgi:hypothetical protein
MPMSTRTSELVLTSLIGSARLVPGGVGKEPFVDQPVGTRTATSLLVTTREAEGSRTGAGRLSPGSASEVVRPARAAAAPATATATHGVLRRRHATRRAASGRRLRPSTFGW